MSKVYRLPNGDEGDLVMTQVPYILTHRRMGSLVATSTLCRGRVCLPGKNEARRACRLHLAVKSDCDAARGATSSCCFAVAVGLFGGRTTITCITISLVQSTPSDLRKIPMTGQSGVSDR